MLYLLKTHCTTQLLTTTCSTRVAGQIVEAASNKGWHENEEDDQVRYIQQLLSKHYCFPDNEIFIYLSIYLSIYLFILIEGQSLNQYSFPSGGYSGDDNNYNIQGTKT